MNEFKKKPINHDQQKHTTPHPKKPHKPKAKQHCKFQIKVYKKTKFGWKSMWEKEG